MEEEKKTLMIDRDKAILECANQFMVRTKLNEASWQKVILEELRDVLEMLYGCGYDHGRNEILFHQAKEILQMGDYGNVVATHKSVNEAARAMNGDPSNIRAVLYSRQHKAYGFSWRYADSFFDHSTTKDPQDEEDIG